MNGVSHISSMRELQVFIRKHHIIIIRKPSSKMYGFEGLHYGLDDEFGLRIPLHTVWIDKNLHGRQLFRVLKHEVDEMELMLHGSKYFSAHKIATRDETR